MCCEINFVYPECRCLKRQGYYICFLALQNGFQKIDKSCLRFKSTIQETRIGAKCCGACEPEFRAREEQLLREEEEERVRLRGLMVEAEKRRVWEEKEARERAGSDGDEDEDELNNSGWMTDGEREGECLIMKVTDVDGAEREVEWEDVDVDPVKRVPLRRHRSPSPSSSTRNSWTGTDYDLEVRPLEVNRSRRGMEQERQREIEIHVDMRPEVPPKPLRIEKADKRRADVGPEVPPKGLGISIEIERLAQIKKEKRRRAEAAEAMLAAHDGAGKSTDKRG